MLNNSFLGEINDINGRIYSGDLVNTPSFFKSHIERIENEDVNIFENDKSARDYRLKIYELGKMFSNKNPERFFEVLKSVRSEKNKEVIDFIYSEIIWNFFEQNNEYVVNELKNYIKDYPTNPEFHHTYSHILEKNKNFDKALFEAKNALKIEPVNNQFFSSYIEKVMSYFDFLLEKGKVENAEKFLNDEILVINHYSKICYLQNETNNILARIKDRLKDHKSIENKIIFFEKEIENSIKISEKRIIEIVGLFSAIVAFILANIQIALKNLSVKEMLILMFGMSLVLIIFSITISYLFGKIERRRSFFHFLKKPKFYSLIFCLLILIILIINI